MIKEEFFKILPSLYEICIRVGELQVKHHKTKLNYQKKKDNTLVTEVDIISSQMIKDSLQKLTPEIPVISEEHYTDEFLYSDFWIVDPLDGTSNYINNGTNFCINIGLISENKSVLGLIYSPITKDLYYAFKNSGAFFLKYSLNPVKINTLVIKNDDKKLIYLSSSINKKVIEILSTELTNVEFINCASALKFGYIASGNGCFYPRLGPTHEWDTASGQCIIEEAGGLVLDKNMNPLAYNKNSSYLNNEFFVISDGRFDWSKVIKLITHL